MSKKFQVRVHVQAQDESLETVLVNYLNSKSTLYPLQHMAMIALRCYWLPLACLDNSSIAKENRNRVILDCIYRIKLQIQDFQEMLETAPAGSSLASVPATAANTAKSTIKLGVDVVKKLRVRFQVQAQDESLEAVLLDYLTSRSAPYPFDDMVITALRSFWLPFAYRDSKLGIKIEKDRVIQDCIDRLKLQKQYLQEMLAPTTVEAVGPNESSPVTDQAHESAPELATVVTDGVVDGATENEEIWDPYKELT